MQRMVIVLEAVVFSYVMIAVKTHLVLAASVVCDVRFIRRSWLLFLWCLSVVDKALDSVIACSMTVRYASRLRPPHKHASDLVLLYHAIGRIS